MVYIPIFLDSLSISHSSFLDISFKSTLLNRFILCVSGEETNKNKRTSSGGHTTSRRITVYNFCELMLFEGFRTI